MVKLIPRVRRSAALDHERLTSLINSMADGVIATDESSKIAIYNGAALNILDVNSSMEGKAISSLINLIDKDNQPVALRQIIAQTKSPTTNRDYRLVYPDGSTINLYLSIAPVRLGFGDSGKKGFVFLLRDITHEKSLEEERDEFISVVSHELRTPIAITEGNIGNALFIVQKQPNADPGVVEALKQAHEQTIFLAGLINDLSTLSRAERGKLNVDIEAINAHELILELVKTYTEEAQAKSLTIEANIDEKLELLHSSRLYVQEILQNFITNAIKYTEKGSVTVAAKAKPRGVEFSVSDTGIGVSKPDLEKLFDKFFRSEDFRTRKNSGTGLGLYVTLKLARLIHAEIEVQSQLNVGSTFKIFVPNLK